MNLCTSVFVYIGSIVLYKRIVNADTQSIRIANYGWTGTLSLLKRDENFFYKKSSEGVLKPIVEQKNAMRRELLRLQKLCF